ncbi:hypothetical protein QJS10_CPB15g01057 [Acorus calamus]|uniref:RRM domain-containing protein n=1 Tax=Acorus calamus TaxID=4465 RepID=A0AAV9D7G5_ACOCL|nr:hypothetical protein QJS10_CPB15g01057 [Acorus calamus]
MEGNADDGFIGDEEDEDYDDLYNDVNVGEGFHQSLQRNNQPGFADRGPPPSAEVQGVPPPPLHPLVNPKVQIARPDVNQGINYAGVRAPAQPFPPMMPSSGGDSPGGGGLRVDLGSNERQFDRPNYPPQNSNEGFARPGGPQSNAYNAHGGGGGGGMTLFVGELHWWTTDADLERELCKYGQVKEVKFFDERVSGKSKGYCQVDFFEPAAATACKEGMNGHVFNGRSCLVTFASPNNIRRMGEARMSKNQAPAGQNGLQVQQGRQVSDSDSQRGGGATMGGNYGRGAGAGGGWGRGRGQMGPIWNRAGAGGRGGFGPPALPHMMPPQTMGFAPTYGMAAAAAQMGRMGGYGGFPGGPPVVSGGPPFPAVMSPFLPMAAGAGGMGLGGVAPHVNQTFFGRGMGMMPGPGMDGQRMGMWTNPSMGGGWVGEEGGGVGRAGESSCGEDAASDYQYGEPSNDMMGGDSGRSNGGRETSGSERRYLQDDREKDMGHDLSKRRPQRDDREWERERERNWDFSGADSVDLDEGGGFLGFFSFDNVGYASPWVIALIAWKRALLNP